MSMILDALGRPLDEPKATNKILDVPRGGKLDYIEGGQLKSWTAKTVHDPYSNNGVVRRAITVMAQNLAQLPIKFMNGKRQLPSEGYKDPTKVDLRTIFDSPNPTDSRVRFFIKHWSYYLIYDKVYWMLNRNPAGFIKELYPLNPALVETIVDKNNIVKHYIYNRLLRIIPDDMLVFSGFNPNTPTGDGGSSILDALKLEYESDYYAAKFGKKFFENSTRVNGVITVDKDVPSTKEDMEAVLAMWKKAHQGADNAYKVGALLSGMNYTEMGQTMRDMEYIEGRKEITQRIIQTYGIPNSVYGLVEKIDRATAETQMRQFWQLTLKPLAVMLQEDVNHKIKKEPITRYSNMTIKFDFSVVEELKKDLNDTLDAAKKLMEVGYPRNEINERLQLDMPDDTDDGDTRYMPSNMMEIGAEEEPLEPLPIPERDEEDEKLAGEILDKIYKDEENKANKQILNNYLRAQKKEEKRFKGKIQKYILEQRNEMLKILYGYKATLNKDEIVIKINSEMKKQDAKIVKVAKPMLSEASKIASELAFVTIGFDKPAVVDTMLVEARVAKIGSINNTIKKALVRELTDGIRTGESVNTMANRWKKVFGFSKTQAKTIARTETASIMSGTTMNTYKKEGIKKKMWLTAEDGAVRPDHTTNAKQKAIPIDEVFSGTGEMYPGQTEINCRCALAPVVQ